MTEHDKNTLEYIVERLLSYAEDDAQEARKNNSEFNRGRVMAHIEQLSVLQNCLSGMDYNLKDFGLDFDVDNKYADCFNKKKT